MSTITSTTASMLSASLIILELRLEAERSCASRRLIFLGNSALLPRLPPSGQRYSTLADASKAIAVTFFGHFAALAIARRLQRTSENPQKAKFREFLFHALR